MVGRAVMADVTSSAENRGTAMNKVADLFVRLGQRGIILAAILMMEYAPSEPTKEFWQDQAAQILLASAAMTREILTRAGAQRADRLFGSHGRDHVARTSANLRI
jgi:hypothetical protein